VKKRKQFLGRNKAKEKTGGGAAEVEMLWGSDGNNGKKMGEGKCFRREEDRYDRRGKITREKTLKMRGERKVPNLRVLVTGTIDAAIWGKGKSKKEVS